MGMGDEWWNPATNARRLAETKTSAEVSKRRWLRDFQSLVPEFVAEALATGEEGHAGLAPDGCGGTWRVRVPTDADAGNWPGLQPPKGYDANHTPQVDVLVDPSGHLWADRWLGQECQRSPLSTEHLVVVHDKQNDLRLIRHAFVLALARVIDGRAARQGG